MQVCTPFFLPKFKEGRKERKKRTISLRSRESPSFIDILEGALRRLLYIVIKNPHSGGEIQKDTTMK